jgi:hypothetical protein
MNRTSWALLAGIILTVPGVARAGVEDVAGTWKVSLLQQDRKRTLWIIQIDAKDGKLNGSILAAEAKQLQEVSSLQDLSLTGGTLRFLVKVQAQTITFEMKAPPVGSRTTTGYFSVKGQAQGPAQLDRTHLKSLDTYDLGLEILSRADAGPELFDAALNLISEAADHKAKPEEVSAWASRAEKAAAAYGEGWQREITLRIAEALSKQEGYGKLAVEYGRRAERQLDPKAKPVLQRRVLVALARSLKQDGQAAESKQVEARLEKVDVSFKPVPFAGRKGKSDRVVLVELFTGAHCPPCVGADLAFDALDKTYKTSEVILLQYHLHIPGPDPLTNADTEARQEYYGLDSTPMLLIDGKVGPEGGGRKEDAEDKYDEYRNAIGPLLEAPAKAKLRAAALRKGDKIDITAEVTDLESPGEKVRLRLALVEDEVQYKGGNQLPTHHRVVRALPGGQAGIALKSKTGKQSVTIDLGDLRKNLQKYLDDNKFPDTDRPLEFKSLRVVAFVQNDANKEILQAVEVPVK